MIPTKATRKSNKWLSRKYRIYTEGVSLDWLNHLVDIYFPDESSSITRVGGTLDMIVELYSGDREQVELFGRMLREEQGATRVLWSESSAVR